MPVFYISFVNNELKMVVTLNAYRYPFYFRCYIKWVHQACFQINKRKSWKSTRYLSLGYTTNTAWQNIPIWCIEQQYESKNSLSKQPKYV